jgi:hypothetical protein
LFENAQVHDESHNSNALIHKILYTQQPIKDIDFERLSVLDLVKARYFFNNEVLSDHVVDYDDDLFLSDYHMISKIERFHHTFIELNEMPKQTRQLRTFI